MPRSLCLTRHCLGLKTRIECEVRPLAVGNGLWVLLCAAGMAGSQPSVIRAQGPFHGPLEAEGVLAAIAASLAAEGYALACDPAIWRLHLLGELHRLNARGGHGLAELQLRSET